MRFRLSGIPLTYFDPYSWAGKNAFPLAAAMLRLHDEDHECAIGWASVVSTDRALRKVDQIEAWRLVKNIPSVWG